MVAHFTRERRPSLPILVITGNADRNIFETKASDLPVLRKPFKRRSWRAYCGPAESIERAGQGLSAGLRRHASFTAYLGPGAIGAIQR